MTSIELRGLKEAMRASDTLVRDIAGDPLMRAVADATMLVTHGARRRAKVDTGRWRASITPEVRRLSEREVQGVVGSNIAHAPYAHDDTRPHWPPPGALAVWARRHGIPEYLARRAIARRGTKGDYAIENALLEHSDRIFRMLGTGIDIALQRWGAGGP